MYLKKDVFFVMSLTRLKNISEKMSFVWRIWDVSSKSQKDVFSVTSLRRLKNILRKYLWFFKNTPEKWFRVISVGLLQYLIK